MKSLLLTVAISATVLVSATLNAAIRIEKCSSYGNCKNCTESANEGCGWCAGKCVGGTLDGPAKKGVCEESTTTRSTWYWHEMQCPASNNCTQFDGDCANCGATEGCGYCDGQCLGGNSTGPGASGANCGDKPWRWEGEGCPTPMPPPPARSICALETTCSSCTGSLFSDCGWCNGECYQGDSTGPSHFSCNGTSWQKPRSTTCPTVAPTPVPPPTPPPGPRCSQYNNCHDCTFLPENENCGWCIEKGCIEGTNPNGPTAPGTCPKANWHWEGAHCPTPPPTPMPPSTPLPPTPPTPAPPTQAPPPTCESYTDGGCTVCTRDAASEACGWCNSQCRPGNASGPFAGNSMCNNTAWHYEGVYCPAAPPTPVPPPPPSVCTAWLSCRSCIGLGFGGCGWCGGKCHAGNSSEPTREGVCPGNDTWIHSTEECPPLPTPAPTPSIAPECHRKETCYSCTGFGNTVCGFCSTTRECSEGSINGPNNSTCPGTWTYGEGSCPTRIGKN